MKPKLLKTGGVWWAVVDRSMGGRCSYCLGASGFAEALQVARWEGETMLVRQMEDALFAEYAVRKTSARTVAHSRRVLGHLRQFLSGLGTVRTLADLGTEPLTRYAQWRLEDHAMGTVHQEIKIIRRALRILVDWGTVARLPRMPPVRPSPPRQGFLTDRQIDAVVAELDTVLQPLVRFLSLTGWRVSEAKGLRWTSVDFTHGMVRLEPGTTKTRDAREFPFRYLRQLGELLRKQRSDVSRLEILLGKVIPWVFCRRAGGPIVRCDVAWTSACRRAGYPGRHVHDLRRSAVRRLELAGVPRAVGMRLTGHRSEKVYMTYAMASPQDMEDGVRRLERFLDSVNPLSTQLVTEKNRKAP